MNGAMAISQAILREGVRTVFALAGASHARLLDALDTDGVRIISARHETSAVVAADGYSRIAGKPGFALIISKQGLPNAVTGLVAALQACSPVVVLLARNPIAQDETGGAFDDELALVRPTVKWARAVTDANRLAEYVHHACHVARSGRPGPVVLVIPTDLFAAPVDDLRRADEPLLAPPPPHPAPEAVARAAGLLAQAERPLIIAGRGAVHAGPGLRQLAHDFGVPVLGHALGRGVVPEDMARGFPWPLAQVAAKDADVVLALGARLTDRLGFGLPPRFSPTARFIQVDVAAEELRRARHIDVPIVADAGTAAAAIAESLAARFGRLPDRTAYVHQALAARLARIAELGHGDDGPLHPYRVVRELTARLPSDAIVSGDGADALNWLLAYLRVHQAPGYLDHYPSGSMGIGTPLAIGAAAAAREAAETTGAPRRPVVTVTGDGAFGFYLAELNSMVLAGLPIVTVVINDNAWGTEYHGQQRLLGRTVNVALGETRYDRIADGFGCVGLHVASPTEVKPTLDRAFAAAAAGKPVVVDCWTDREAGADRKRDPRLQMVPHDDINTSRKPHVTPSVA